MTIFSIYFIVPCKDTLFVQWNSLHFRLLFDNFDIQKYLFYPEQTAETSYFLRPHNYD